MLNYDIKKYAIHLIDRDDWEERINDNYVCGNVTNYDDDSFVIPIIVDDESPSAETKNFLPNFMGAMAKRIALENDPRSVPWIIKCDLNDLQNLRNGDEKSLVMLYHEIGHFQYSDEQDPNLDDKARIELLRNGEIPNEEIQADRVAAIALGKDKVINTLNNILALVLMTPRNEVRELFIREFQIRIRALQKLDLETDSPENN